MAHGDFKDLPKRIASNKVLHVQHSKLLVIQTMKDINTDLQILG